MNAPIADKPTTSMIAGRRTAHSREGNQLWIGLEISKKGYPRDVINELEYKPRN